MKTMVSLCLVVLGLIHVLPLIGVLGPDRLEVLYGVSVAQDASLSLLLRHRAVLFGLLGGAMLVAVKHPPWQGPALLAAGISVLSFMALAGWSGPLTPALYRVLWVDGLACVCLALGTWAWWRQSSVPVQGL